MKTQKIILGGIAGGIVFFILGFIVYAKLLHNFEASHPGSIPHNLLMRTKEEMKGQILYIVVGNMAYGFLLALIFGRWGNISNVMAGMIAGFVIGLLMAAGFHCISYGATNIMSRAWLLVDTLSFGVITAITGGAVAWILGMNNKPVGNVTNPA